MPLVLIRRLASNGLVFTEGFSLTKPAPRSLGTEGRRGDQARGLGWENHHLPVEYRIVGDDVRGAPTGEVGELLIQNPNVFVGYWQKPDASREVLDEDGWFHSGDLARRCRRLLPSSIARRTW